MLPITVRLLPLPLLLAACGTGGAPAGAGAPPPPQVAVVAVEAQAVPLVSRLPGRTAPFRVAEVRPQVSGLVQKRLFDEGSDVAAGQALYQLDPAPFAAALASARAGLARAEASRVSVKARAERLKALIEQRVVSPQDYDDAAAALAQVEAEIAALAAQIETARINLAYATITAPIAGRIGRSTVTEGAAVTAYQPLALATIHQLDPIYVDVPQSTADQLRIRRAQEAGRLRRPAAAAEVALLLDDGSRYPLAGALRFRDVAVDPATGSSAVRLEFPNPHGLLLPEMFVRVEIPEGTDERALLVPQGAVMRNAKGQPYVFVVDAAGSAGQRMIAVEREVDGRWLVTDGLASGDRVVVEGLQALQMRRPGQPIPVAVAPAAPPAATAAAAAGAR